MTAPAHSTLRRNLALLIGVPLILAVALFTRGFSGNPFAGTSDLLALAQDLRAEFREPTVGINVSDGGTLTLTLDGASFAGLDSAQRADKATAIARFALTHWRGTDRVTSVAIKLSTTSGVPGVTMTRTETPFSFSASELVEPATDTLTPPPAAP